MPKKIVKREENLHEAIVSLLAMSFGLFDYREVSFAPHLTSPANRTFMFLRNLMMTGGEFDQCRQQAIYHNKLRYFEIKQKQLMYDICSLFGTSICLETVPFQGLDLSSQVHRLLFLPHLNVAIRQYYDPESVPKKRGLTRYRSHTEIDCKGLAHFNHNSCSLLLAAEQYKIHKENPFYLRLLAVLPRNSAHFLYDSLLVRKVCFARLKEIPFSLNKLSQLCHITLQLCQHLKTHQLAAEELKFLDDAISALTGLANDNQPSDNYLQHFNNYCQIL